MGRAAQPESPNGKRRSRSAPWSPTASREEVRDYLEERLALFSKLMFWIFWVLVIFVVALYELYPGLRPARAAVVLQCAIGGLVVLGVTWYLALHRRDCTIEGLYRIDAFYATAIGALFGLSAYLTSDQVANVYSAFIWHTFMVFTRVIILPSTGRRSAVLTSVSFLPLCTAAIALALEHPEGRVGLPPLALVGGTFVFATVAVLLATTGSRVIYGLRQQVREAQQLGQYTLEKKIGEGGMGVVYKARHAMLRRPTAIKLLPRGKVGAHSVQRFEREVQHTSRLTHPNTVAIYDYGRSPNGVFYYAMEYLDGIDLETLVRRYGPQPAPRVVHLLRQVCGALDEAHTMGLVHRDIKPANILLIRRADTPDVVKVVDFGLVEEVTAEGDDATTMIIAGTPAYLAPEAITDPNRVGPGSDLYAVGAVGYFLLTGQRVFEGRTLVDVCVQHASTAPIPPSQRSSAPLSAELEALILACLSKDPAARPATARALQERLAALPDYQGWNEAEARDWWRRFEESRRDDPGADAATPSPFTITVDLADRRQALAEAVTEPPLAGRAATPPTSPSASRPHTARGSSSQAR